MCSEQSGCARCAEYIKALENLVRRSDKTLLNMTPLREDLSDYNLDWLKQTERGLYEEVKYARSVLARHKANGGSHKFSLKGSGDQKGMLFCYDCGISQEKGEAELTVCRGYRGGYEKPVLARHKGES